MGTHCFIAFEHADGQLSVRYCHFDGYAEHTGKVLLSRYDRAKLAVLIKREYCYPRFPILTMKYRRLLNQQTTTFDGLRGGSGVGQDTKEIPSRVAYKSFSKKYTV